MLKNLRHKALLLGTLSSVSLVGACGGSNGGLISIGAIDPDAIAEGFSNSSIASSEIPLTPAQPATEEPVSPISVEPTNLRRGMDEVLGYNKISWTYTLGDSPTVDEFYFFTESDISIDADLGPQILKFLDNNVGVILVFYVANDDDTANFHSMARIYSDESVLVHLFETHGESSASGEFVYCFPDEDIETCVEDLVLRPDGTMQFQNSPAPIAFSDPSTNVISNPAEVPAWIRYAAETSDRPKRPVRTNSRPVNAEYLTEILKKQFNL